MDESDEIRAQDIYDNVTKNHKKLKQEVERAKRLKERDIPDWTERVRMMISDIEMAREGQDLTDELEDKLDILDRSVRNLETEILLKKSRLEQGLEQSVDVKPEKGDTKKSKRIREAKTPKTSHKEDMKKYEDRITKRPRIPTFFVVMFPPLIVYNLAVSGMERAEMARIKKAEAKLKSETTIEDQEEKKEIKESKVKKPKRKQENKWARIKESSIDEPKKMARKSVDMSNVSMEWEDKEIQQEKVVDINLKKESDKLEPDEALKQMQWLLEGAQADPSKKAVNQSAVYQIINNTKQSENPEYLMGMQEVLKDFKAISMEANQQNQLEETPMSSASVSSDAEDMIILEDSRESSSVESENNSIEGSERDDPIREMQGIISNMYDKIEAAGEDIESQKDLLSEALINANEEIHELQRKIDPTESQKKDIAECFQFVDSYRNVVNRSTNEQEKPDLKKPEWYTPLKRGEAEIIEYNPDIEFHVAPKEGDEKDFNIIIESPEDHLPPKSTLSDTRSRILSVGREMCDTSEDINMTKHSDKITITEDCGYWDAKLDVIPQENGGLALKGDVDDLGGKFLNGWCQDLGCENSDLDIRFEGVDNTIDPTSEKGEKAWDTFKDFTEKGFNVKDFPIDKFKGKPEYDEIKEKYDDIKAEVEAKDSQDLSI